MSTEDKRPLLHEIAEEVLDMPPKGQWLVYLENDQPFLLSLSSFVGEEDLFKIWIQGAAPIKIDEYGEKVEPYDQLIFKGNFISDNKLELCERHGYENIEKGEELEFLGRLISEGRMELIDKSQSS